MKALVILGIILAAGSNAAAECDVMCEFEAAMEQDLAEKEKEKSMESPVGGACRSDRDCRAYKNEMINCYKTDWSSSEPTGVCIPFRSLVILWEVRDGKK